MGVKVTLSYPMVGDTFLDYPEADDWRMGDNRTLLITRQAPYDTEKPSGTYTKAIAQLNADAWSLVEEYETEPIVGEDTNEELEPPL